MELDANAIVDELLERIKSLTLENAMLTAKIKSDIEENNVKNSKEEE